MALSFVECRGFVSKFWEQIILYIFVFLGVQEPVVEVVVQTTISMSTGGDRCNPDIENPTSQAYLILRQSFMIRVCLLNN